MTVPPVTKISASTRAFVFRIVPGKRAIVLRGEARDDYNGTRYLFHAISSDKAARLIVVVVG